jgi:glycyl-tRNA synthetase beta chain
MSLELLLEIGCEEIPAKFVSRALAELPAQVSAKLAAARLTHAGVSVMGTPRRLVVMVRGLEETQPDLREDVVGPPVSAAFGPDGAPTKAGIGFAQKNGVDPASLEQREVPGKKGLYAIARRHIVGQSTRGLLPELLAGIVGGITWAKSMRWGWGETAFVRPVQWILALYGGEVVPFSWGGVSSGRQSHGHRFLAPGAVEISSPDGYLEAMRRAFVIVDPEARRNVVVGELSRIERATGLRVRPDDELIDEVVQLGEYPVGVCGQFNPAFLEVPEEVIVTAMRTHQRYFALEDAAGKLAPRFVTMMATVVKEPSVVEAGNQRVLASRLSDARFFFTEDQKKPLSEWGKKLDSVVFQAKLGDQARTIGHKVRRIVALSGEIAKILRCDAAVVKRAAELCKCDLATGSVGEFPELQGVMGMHYARLQNEGDAVAVAIAEHYLPKGQGGALPSTMEGAIVALADRIDTLVGCFATGLSPSGSADPLGLRRAAVGVLQILLDRGQSAAVFRDETDFPLTFGSLVNLGASTFEGLVVSKEAKKELLDFFRARLRGILMDEGLRTQDVDAALNAGAMRIRDEPCDARLRARALGHVPAAAREVWKRIVNIIDDAHSKGIEIEQTINLSGARRPSPDPELFVAPDNVEHRLWNAFCAVNDELNEALANREYETVFRILVQLQPAVAAFFDKGGVMVMDPDAALRNNRLALLQTIALPFANVADLRLLGGAA